MIPRASALSKLAKSVRSESSKAANKPRMISLNVVLAPRVSAQGGDFDTS